MQTNFNAAAAVMAGQLDLVVSAGVEMMSRVPMGSNGGSISERVTDRYDIVMQGISAELLAEEWSLSRDELDAYSLESHRRAIAASDGGRFEREIVPIELPAEGGEGAGGSPGPASVEPITKWGSGRCCAHAVRRRRGAAARDLGREARRAAACIPPGRGRDRRAAPRRSWTALRRC